MSDLTPRPLLPYIAQSIPAAPMTSERRGEQQQRSYVFVDEQNRHRRLKVVRACEGCRKRKIRCDSANTNTWPCSACQRLKMHCVPPPLSFESDDTQDVDRSAQIAFPLRFTAERPGAPTQYNYPMPTHPQQLVYDNAPSHPVSNLSYQHNQYSQTGQSANILATNHNAPRYAPLAISTVGDAPTQNHYGISQHYSLVPNTGPTGNGGAVKTEVGDAANLSEYFGNLKVSNDAVAEYIVAQKELATAPVMQDTIIQLPEQACSDLTVRIPLEWMPDDALALQYFDYFFENVHPYVPVINSTSFNRLWISNKQSISPITLEAVFACAAFAMKRMEDGNRWLALASRHEESFKDVPRLSTIQGMLLLLKAREAVPKRGYYYRSWMTIVNLIEMAKDLELDQHFEIHRMGQSCGATSPDECATKTRVWHMLFAIELIVGGPQGRTKYSVPLDTVDFEGVMSLPGLDEKEVRYSNNFTHFLKCIRNVRRSNLLYSRLKKEKANWATDTEFVQHNQDFDQWLTGLPQSLQIIYPPDGSAPWVKFHFVANLHAYHNMSILVHYRPQLEQVPQSPDGLWKQRMDECYSAAKNICRLQEGLLQNCGLEGLLHMLRGVNFHIYAILAAVNIHLVALTSPDPKLNHDAPEYFSRHMRLLERCSNSWPMPEISAQIESLRQAFSADLAKPFELKPGISYSSPARSESLSPQPNDPNYLQQQHDHSQMSTYNSFPMVSPTLNEGVSRADFVPNQPYLSQGPPQVTYNGSAQTMPNTQLPHWDPSKIFEHFDTAFGNHAVMTMAQTPPSQTTPSPIPSYAPHHPSNPNFINYGQNMLGVPDYRTHMQSPPAHMGMIPTYQPPQPQPLSVVPPIPPSAWVEVVATANGGNKRRWQGGQDQGHGHGDRSNNASSKRMR